MLTFFFNFKGGTFSIGNILGVKAAMAVVGKFDDDIEIIGCSIHWVFNSFRLTTFLSKNIFNNYSPTQR